MLRGLSHGGWVPAETGNFHLYTLVIGSQTLHATGYAMGIAARRRHRHGRSREGCRRAGLLRRRGDQPGRRQRGAVFAASYQTPQVFFLQNNHWAISVPVERQSRTPLYLRAERIRHPRRADRRQRRARQLRGDLREPRRGTVSGAGPALHRGADLSHGRAHLERRSDQVPRLERGRGLGRRAIRSRATRRYLRRRGEGDAFFHEVAQEAEDLAADVRARTLALQDPPSRQDVRSTSTPTRIR